MAHACGYEEYRRFLEAHLSICLNPRTSHSLVVNAQHMKAVPGRKTDVKDAEWIAQLLRHGLLTASYIPDRTQRGTA